MKAKYIIATIALLALIVFSCKKEPPIPSHGNKIEIGETTTDSLSYFAARISTTVENTGGNNITQHGHCWSTQSKPTTADAKTTLGKLDQAGTFSSQLTDLQNNTTYYVRSYVIYKYGEVYGEEQSITTIETRKAVVGTVNVTNVTKTTAICGGTNDDGGLTIAVRGVCWNTSGSPTLDNSIAHTTDGSGTGSFTSNITDLSENTTYYVAAYATNEKGTAYGEVKSFTTLEITLAVVATADITNITINSAAGGGNVSSSGNGVVTVRGICWNTAGSPTLENSIAHTTDGSGTGSFTSQLTGLLKNTTYYVSAYATNEKGTAYGELKDFLATNNFIDPRDGQSYETVIIGSQTWFAENLNYKTSNAWCYDYKSTNCDVYGRLYTWEEAKNACPRGWHLPSDDEWKTLEMALGMSQSEADDTGWRDTDEGGKLKETGTAHWNSPNTGATNSSGFTALPGGLPLQRWVVLPPWRQRLLVVEYRGLRYDRMGPGPAL